MNSDISDLPEYFSVDENQSDAYNSLAAGLAVQRSSSSRIPVPSQQPPHPVIDPELLTDGSVPLQVYSTEEDDDNNADLLEASGKAIRIPVPLDEAPRPSAVGDLKMLWPRSRRSPASAVEMERPQYVSAPLPGVTPSSLFGPAASSVMETSRLRSDIMAGVRPTTAATEDDPPSSSSPSPTPAVILPQSSRSGVRSHHTQKVRMRALWQEYFDKTHQRHYYYNTVTRETVWQLPADYGAQIPASGDTGGDATGADQHVSTVLSSSKSPISFAVAGDGVSDDDDNDDDDGGLLGSHAVPADVVSPRSNRGQERTLRRSGRRTVATDNTKRRLDMATNADGGYSDEETGAAGDEYEEEEEEGEEEELQPQRYYRQPLSEIWTQEKNGIYAGFAVRDEEHLEVKDNNIMAGTLDKLIERLTHHSEHSIEFMYGFLLTFRAFTDPETVLGKIRLRYNTPPPEGCSRTEFEQFRDNFLLPVRLRICQVLKTWMKKHFYDFRRNSALREELEDFIGEINETGNRMTASTLNNCFRKNAKTRNTFTAQQMNEYNDAIVSSTKETSDAPATELPLAQYKKMMKRMREGGLASAETSTLGGMGGEGSGGDTGLSPGPGNGGGRGSLLGAMGGDSAVTLSIPLLEWPAVELARQVTLIDFEQFSMILSRECLIENLKRKKRSERAPNVDRMMQRTNTISHWVIHEILRPPSAKNRVHILRKFIEIAYHCREMGNFHSAFIICGALLSNAVYRLRQTWEGIGSKHQRMVDELFELTDASQNFGKMRTAVQQVRPPSLPYLGMFIKDLLAIEEASPDYINGLINFAKFRMLTRVVRDIKVYQQTPFVYRSVHEVREKLLNVNPPDSQTLYELSRKREGKKRKNHLQKTFQNLTFSNEDE
eukprot:gb/GECH01002331.1/.p1 GENE.gb/GECH01002331.1/~~gb/GECH01002331.1/.p1  ORF type:complete len:888 (+),score=218.72 gb/GECH01002331.1/:1-2664(+)